MLKVIQKLFLQEEKEKSNLEIICEILSGNEMKN